ncbi:diguanylate cyclase domain protein [Clostridiales bacterium oral taxon 876 str. F0540]|nr:diguanylate cyclase domain protein [Clostridiales bacterium oral taxon 876 str. F0540]
MNLINNRYRILKNLKQNRLVSEYLVSDIKNENEKFQLNIINSEYLPESLLDFYVKEFSSLVTIDKQSFVRLYNFDSIQTIDSKKIESLRYFYVNEYLEANYELINFIDGMNEKEVLELIIELCQSINYLHLRGFIYGCINLDNIFISNSKIKFKDMATVELEKYDYWNLKNSQLIFKAPEILEDKMQSVSSDIYSLGILLLLIVKKQVKDNLSTVQEIKKTEKHFTKSYFEFLNKLTPIIDKMINHDIKKRYINIRQIIEDINKEFGTSYKAHYQSEIEKLNFNTKLIGREYEINNIINIYNSMSQLGLREKFVIVHGEYGIGKTKLLKELERILLLKNVNVYSSYNLETSNYGSNRAAIDIIKRIISECDSELLERYEGELIKIIPELGNNKNIVPSIGISGDKENIRLAGAVCAFINDFMKGKPAVFIIDNLHKAGEFSIDILEYLYLRNKSIMFVFSYCDGDLTNNKKLSEFIMKVSGQANIIDIPLRGLNNDDSVSLIQNVLRMPVRPNIFGERIFSKTFGNPLFIEETIKNLYSQNNIYVDERSGIWNSKFDYDYSKLPVPSDMEQAVLSQIKEIDDLSLEILNGISIFNTAISIEDITKIVLKDTSDVLEKVNYLELRGVLCKKIEDRGFVYDFSNRILKSLIRKTLDKDYKKKKHELAAELLEMQLNDGLSNREELIYHLEKAGHKEKVIKYCLETADKMELFKNRREAIKNLIRAVSIIDENDQCYRKAELLIRIGDIYHDDGNGVRAIESFKEAESLAVTQDKYKIQIEALNRIAKVYFSKNEIDKASSYIKKSEEILKKSNILEEDIKIYFGIKDLQARILLMKQEYKDAEKICRYCIELCKEDEYKFKGLFYKNLGNIYLDNSMGDKALSCYKESLKCFEKIDYSEGIVIALNNISVVYADIYQNNKESINYLKKVKEISERNHIIKYEIMALTNLACSYFEEWNYELSLEYFLDALKKSQKIDYEGNVFYCYNYLSNIYLKLRDFKKAYEYHLLAKKELEEYPEHGKEIAIYYQMSSELFYNLGDSDKAYYFINKALDVYKNDESLQKLECSILSAFISFDKLEGGKDLDARIQDIFKIINKFQLPIKKVEKLYYTSFELHKRGFEKQAENLFNEAENYKINDKPDILKIKEFYLRGIFAKGTNSLKELNTCFEISKIKKDDWTRLNVCSELGDYYFYSRDYFYSINFYFEACEIIKKLTLSVPDEFKVKFVIKNDLLNPFKKLATLKSYREYDKVLFKENMGYDEIDIEKLNKLFTFEDVKEILNNEYFIRSARRLYNSYLPKTIRSSSDIVKSLYSNPVKNLELIVKYLASITIATRSIIVIDGNDQTYNVVASMDGSNLVPRSKYVFEKAKSSREAILMTDAADGDASEFNVILQGAKAIICVPIIMNMENSNDNQFGNSIKGYIYLESERILNNFNKDTLKKCVELSRLAGINIERHQLLITSSTDKLTGALTRKFLEEALSEQIDRADECNNVFSIIMMDMDHFKQINDRFGHQAGDEVLRRACDIVRNNIRKNDIFGRYGGEEFIIILPQTDCKGALVIAEKLRKAVEEAKILGDKTSVTMSLGIATYPHNAQWKKELVEKADQALYVSKELGRNRCQVWSNDFSNKVKGRNKLSGIVSGNTVQDSRNILAMVDIIELIKQNTSLENKIYNLLGRIIEITESECGMFFAVDNNELKNIYSRKIFNESWSEPINYNSEAVNSVILKKQGLYMTDWDESVSYDSVTGMPDWHSIVVIPLVKNGSVKGVLYLSVPTKLKEFKFDEFNYINTIGELAAGIL